MAGQGGGEGRGSTWDMATAHHALCAAWSPILRHAPAHSGRQQKRDFCVLAAGTKGGIVALVRYMLPAAGDEQVFGERFSPVRGLSAGHAFVTAVACARAHDERGLAVVGGGSDGALWLWTLGAQALARAGGEGLEARHLKLGTAGEPAVARLAVSQSGCRSLQVAWARRDDEVFACRVALSAGEGEGRPSLSDPVRRVAACCAPRSFLTGLFWADFGEVLCSAELDSAQVRVGYPWAADATVPLQSRPEGRGEGGSHAPNQAPGGVSSGGIFGAAPCGRGFMATAVVGTFLGIHKGGGAKYSLKLQVLDLLPLLYRGREPAQCAERVAAHFCDATGQESLRGLLCPREVWELTASVQAALTHPGISNAPRSSSQSEPFEALLRSLEEKGKGAMGCIPGDTKAAVAGYRSLCLANIIRRAMTPHVGEYTSAARGSEREPSGGLPAEVWCDAIEQNEYAAFKLYVALQLTNFSAGEPCENGGGHDTRVTARLAAWGRVHGLREEALGENPDLELAKEEHPISRRAGPLTVRTSNRTARGGLESVSRFFTCARLGDLDTCVATLEPVGIFGAPWACPSCRRAVVRPAPTPLDPCARLPWCPFCAALAEPTGAAEATVAAPQGVGGAPV